MKVRTAFALLGCTALVLTDSALSADKPGSPRLGDLRGASKARFNQDASRIIVRLRGGEIGLWDVEKGTPMAGDLGLQTPSESFSMSADGRMVLVAFKENARVFDAASGIALSPILNVRPPEDSAPAFSPDRQVLVISEEKEVSIWNVRSGASIAKIPLPARSEDESGDLRASVRFTKDGAHCFLHDGRGTITRLDTKSWQPVGKPMKHPPAESAYDFYFDVSPDGKWIATTDSPGENGPMANLQIWDGATNKAVGAPIVSQNGFRISFLPGVNRVLIGPARGETTARELPSLNTVFKIRPHDDVDEPDFSVSPDGKWILSWGPDRMLNLYDVATGKLAHNSSIAANVSEVFMSPDSSACYIVFENSAFTHEDYEDYYVMKIALPDLKIVGSARFLDTASAALSPDGRRLAVLHGKTDEHRVEVFETATMKSIGSAEE